MAARKDKATAYTARQAAAISGVPYHTLDFWDRSDFINPSVAQAKGSGRGRERRYSFTDLVRLRVARELREQKIPLQALRGVMSTLRRERRDLSDSRLLAVGREVYLVESEERLVALLRRRDQAAFGFILDLRPLVREVERKAKKAA